MKKLFTILTLSIFICFNTQAQACTPLGDEVSFGTSDTWIGYIYDDINFTTYMGFVNEGTAGNPNFDESFGGDYVNYPTNGCSVYTESFTARYKLTKTFAAGNYQFTVGADDGYRLSLDGGTTWVINHWNDQSYNFDTYATTLNGTYNMVIEYYENGGGNRISFNVQTACLGTEDQSIYGSGDVWKGYIYDGTNFNQYNGMVTEGSPGNPNFDEGFGGDNVTYVTSACGEQTESFSARYRLQRNFPMGNYTFTVGGDDGFRLSLDGGSTWVINNWADQSYTTATYSATLGGMYNMVLEYYENGGQNRVSFNISSIVLLPVQLETFSGNAGLQNIHLNWTVSAETNTAFYQVQRSANGIDFTDIGKVPFSNTISTNNGKTYNFIDASPLAGINYYRLRIVDADGKFSLSPVIKFNFTTANTISIYPTLLHAGETIQMNVPAGLKNVVVECYDMSGKKLQEIKLASATGDRQHFNLPIHTQSLCKGTYVLLCKTSNSLVSKQIILIQ